MEKYKVKIEYEEIVEARNEEEASEKFWESKNDIQRNIENFIDDIILIGEVKEQLLFLKIKFGKKEMEKGKVWTKFEITSLGSED